MSPSEITPPRFLTITFFPDGRSALVKPGTRLLDAARRAGIELATDCEGQGFCGKCCVRIVEGEVSKPTEEEKEYLSEVGLSADYRLACMARALGAVKVQLPPCKAGEQNG